MLFMIGFWTFWKMINEQVFSSEHTEICQILGLYPLEHAFIFFFVISMKMYSNWS